MKLVGTLLNIIPNVKNLNKRTYPRAVLEKAVAEYKERYIDTGTAYGELYEGNSSDIVNLSKTTHRITDLRVADDAVIVEANLLKTPMGMLLEDIISPTPIFISRALASMDKDNIVQDDPTFISIDIEKPNA